LIGFHPKNIEKQSERVNMFPEKNQGKRQSQLKQILIEAICFPDTALKSQITILKLQTISKLQIPMTKTFQSLIGCLAVILSVLNFEFRSLIFV